MSMPRSSLAFNSRKLECQLSPNNCLAITIARLATQTCIFPIYEVERVEGRPVYKLNSTSAAIARRPESKKPVDVYLKTQGRFRHLFRPKEDKDLLEAIQENVNFRWELLLEKCGL